MCSASQSTPSHSPLSADTSSNHPPHSAKAHSCSTPQSPMHPYCGVSSEVYVYAGGCQTTGAANEVSRYVIRWEGCGRGVSEVRWVCVYTGGGQEGAVNMQQVCFTVPPTAVPCAPVSRRRWSKAAAVATTGCSRAATAVVAAAAAV